MSDVESSAPNTEMSDDIVALSALLERYRLLVDALKANDAPTRLDQLKADIIAIYKDAEAGMTAFAKVRDEARELVTEWKAVERKAKTPPATTLRVDHLGASTYIEKGWSRLSSGDAAAAEQALRRALELAPDDSESSTLLAWSLVQQQKLSEAREIVDTLLRNKPMALSRAVAGFLAIEEGHVEQAIATLNDAVAASTVDRRAALYAHLYLGIALRKAKRLPAAIDMLRRALELGPNLLEAAYELGHTLMESGDESAALATWRHAASANKFSPWGKRCAEMVAKHEAVPVTAGVSAES